MMIVSDSDVKLTPDFRSRTQHGRAVTGRGTATADHRRRAPKVPLHKKVVVWGNPPLYARTHILTTMNEENAQTVLQ